MASAMSLVTQAHAATTEGTVAHPHVSTNTAATGAGFVWIQAHVRALANASPLQKMTTHGQTGTTMAPNARTTG